MNGEHVNDELLQHYAQRELIPDEAISHIRACPACGSKVQQYMALTSALERRPLAAFDFDTDVLVPAALRPKQHCPWFWLPVALGILAGLFLLTLGFASLGHSVSGLLLACIAIPVLLTTVTLTVLQHLRSWRLLSDI